MQTGTIVLLILAAFVSFFFVLFQYYYKSKGNRTLQLSLSVLRFLALFGTLILLINPKFSKNTYILEKSDLVFLWDNSFSLKSSGTEDAVIHLQEQAAANNALPDRFDITNYSFGNTLNNSDSLSFDETNTNITKALSSINTLYKNKQAIVVLVTDGNQTVGEDYQYAGPNFTNPVYSIVVGDTTKYRDLKINQVNVNKYAFLNNKFPVELYISYQGAEKISSSLSIRLDGKSVYRESLSLDPMNNSKRFSTLIEATSVGLKTLDIRLDSVTGERNTINNQRRVPIEIIDEKTNIGLISNIAHPDLGALIKAIESNNERSVVLLKPGVSEKELEEFDLFILYQPTRTFANIYKYIQNNKRNTFTITGPRTDWRFLNTVQNSLERMNYNQTEEILPILNPGFSLFDISTFSIEDFPPLEGTLGEILITKRSENLLEQRIKSVDINEPLMAIIYDDERRETYLFGENIWKWRMQTYRNEQDFRNFDEFINKVILYLNSDEKRERLSIDYELAYGGSTDKKITASYFDATYSSDSNAQLSVSIKGVGTDFSITLPMVFTNNVYAADISDLPPGNYAFTVNVSEENLSKSGNFEILESNLEQLFVSSDPLKLSVLSQATSGRLYYPNQFEVLAEDLMNDIRFLPKQKSIENVVSLIDFKILLAIIIAALTAEWFIRKYNGLI